MTTETKEAETRSDDRWGATVLRVVGEAVEKLHGIAEDIHGGGQPNGLSGLNMAAEGVCDEAVNALGLLSESLQGPHDLEDLTVEAQDHFVIVGSLAREALREDRGFASPEWTSRVLESYVRRELVPWYEAA